MNYSAGIIPYRLNKEGKYEFFLGHPGGEFWSKKNYWAFLKGGTEEGENWLAAAKREFKEESGIDISEYPDSDFIPLGSVLQNNKKTAIAYALYISDIDCEKCHSNLIEDGVTPEIDKYKWMTFDEVLDCTNNTHIVFYDRLIKILTENR